MSASDEIADYLAATAAAERRKHEHPTESESIVQMTTPGEPWGAVFIDTEDGRIWCEPVAVWAIVQDRTTHNSYFGEPVERQVHGLVNDPILGYLTTPTSLCDSFTWQFLGYTPRASFSETRYRQKAKNNHWGKDPL